MKLPMITPAGISSQSISVSLEERSDGAPKDGNEVKVENINKTKAKTVEAEVGIRVSKLEMAPLPFVKLLPSNQVRAEPLF